MRKNQMRTKEILEAGVGITVLFRYGNTVDGMPICRAVSDGIVLGSTVGGGYDLQGEALADFIRTAYQKELGELDEKEYYGLSIGKKNYVNGATGLNNVLKIIRGLGFTVDERYNKRSDRDEYFIRKI